MNALDTIVGDDPQLQALLRHLDRCEPGWTDHLRFRGGDTPAGLVVTLLRELSGQAVLLDRAERGEALMIDQVRRAGAEPDFTVHGGAQPDPDDPLYVHDPIPPQHRPHGAP